MKNILEEIHAGLEKYAIPERAEGRKRYMKSDMPCCGISAIDCRTTTHDALKKLSITDQEEYEELVLMLWNDQKYREGKYTAIHAARYYKNFITPKSLPLFKKLIKEGAWWDFVDEVAKHLVGKALSKDPVTMWPIMEKWNEDENMWIRRSSIICQLGFKGKTDFDRLFRFCLQRAHEEDFFIRKAIGWALRDYSYAAPEKVLEFITSNQDKLSPLSFREGMKVLLKKQGNQ